MTESVDLHPLSRFLEGWLTGGWPDLARLNECAARMRITTGNGLPLSFSLPEAGSSQAYERRAFESGVVSTRAENRHDLFNALIWLTFPLTKAAMNRCHMLERERMGEPSRRGSVRDSLTHFDECGVLMVSARAGHLWRSLQRHQWTDVFVNQRKVLLERVRFIVFGHASHDALCSPYPGLCGKVLHFEVDEAGLADIDAGRLGGVDAIVADWLQANYRNLQTGMLQPLPMLGIPGATKANELATYYEDVRQFRPSRSARVIGET